MLEQSRLCNKYLINELLTTTVITQTHRDGLGLIYNIYQNYQHILGYEKEEVVQKPAKILMPSPFDAIHDSYIQNFYRAGKLKMRTEPLKVFVKAKDGTVRAGQSFFSLLPTFNSEVLMILFFTRDELTEEEQQKVYILFDQKHNIRNFTPNISQHDIGLSANFIDDFFSQPLLF